MEQKNVISYRSLPIYPETHEAISKIAYETKTPKVKVVQTAIKMLTKKLEAEASADKAWTGGKA